MSTLITDPQTIAALEGKSYTGSPDTGVPSNTAQPSLGTPITDPQTIAALEAAASSGSSSSQSQSFFSAPPSMAQITQQELSPTDFQQGAWHGLTTVGNQAKINLYDRPMDYFFGGNRAAPDQASQQTYNSDPLFQQAMKNSPLATKAGMLVGAGAPLAAISPFVGVEDMGLIPGILSQSGMGSAYGASTSQDPVTGALYGAIGGAGGEGAMRGLSYAASPAIKYIANYFQNAALPSIKSDVTGMIPSMPGGSSAGVVSGATGASIDPVLASNANAFNMVKNNYLNSVQDEADKWNNLKGIASEADSTPGVSYDDTSHVQNLQNNLNNIQQQSVKQSASARANSDSEDLLSGYINDAHGTFNDAIEHQQALNKDYQNELTPGKSLPFNTVNSAISSIKNNFQENIDNIADQANNNSGLSDRLQSAWSDANQATQDKNNTFLNVVGSNGNQTKSAFSKFINNKNPNADPSTFVNSYIPKANQGTQGMQQFSNMVGDSDYAKGVLKQNIFKNPSDSDSFLQSYGQLSPEQQGFLFNPDQQRTINTMQTILKNNPENSSAGFIKNMWSHTIPMLIGASALGGAASHIGMDVAPEAAMTLAGLAAGRGTADLSKAIMSQPLAKQYVINSINKVPVGYLQNSAAQGLRSIPQSMYTANTVGNQ